jgi:manganese efflux pump family protein
MVSFTGLRPEGGCHVSTFYIVMIGVGLAMDACAVAIAASAMLRTPNGRQIFRLAFHFGLFQAVMPILGWLAGRSVGSLVSQWDHWAVFAILTFIGAKAIRTALRHDDDESREVEDPSRGTRLVALSFATSIDAFAVGVSFALLAVNVWYAALIIGLVTAALTVLSMILGGLLGARFGRRMEIVGGLILIAIGVRLLVQHLAR